MVSLGGKLCELNILFKVYMKEGKKYTHWTSNYYPIHLIIIFNDVLVLRYKESIRDIEWLEPTNLWYIHDEGQTNFPTSKLYLLHRKENEDTIKELNEGIASCIRMWKTPSIMRLT